MPEIITVPVRFDEVKKGDGIYHKHDLAEVTATSHGPKNTKLVLSCIGEEVQVAKQGSGNLYAKRLNREAIIEAKANDEMLGKAERWEYIGRRGVFNSLTADTLLSVEEAAEFGHLYGICACCAADLTNEDSIARGIGPVCFGRMG